MVAKRIYQIILLRRIITRKLPLPAKLREASPGDLGEDQTEIRHQATQIVNTLLARIVVADHPLYPQLETSKQYKISQRTKNTVRRRSRLRSEPHLTLTTRGPHLDLTLRTAHAIVPNVANVLHLAKQQKQKDDAATPRVRVTQIARVGIRRRAWVDRVALPERLVPRETQPRTLTAVHHHHTHLRRKSRSSKSQSQPFSLLLSHHSKSVISCQKIKKKEKVRVNLWLEVSICLALPWQVQLKKVRRPCQVFQGLTVGWAPTITSRRTPVFASAQMLSQASATNLPQAYYTIPKTVHQVHRWQWRTWQGVRSVWILKRNYRVSFPTSKQSVYNRVSPSNRRWILQV